MSMNPNNPGIPPVPPEKPGQGPQLPRPAAGVPGSKGLDIDSQDAVVKSLLEKMVQENPAGIAEIIHMWLNQDKNKNE